MTATLQVQIESYQARLDSLIRRGHELSGILVSNPSDSFSVTTTRVWQQDCGTIVNELSGGSKAHWLARSFSQALLFRSETGHAVDEISPDQIIERLLAVLGQAHASLSNTNALALSSGPNEQPTPRRFDFVHNPELRPILEQSYNNSRVALERQNYDEALRTSSGILEAIVTDALEHKGINALAASGAPAEKISEWGFETRLTVAERAGLIRGGWIRLPSIAFSYRSPSEGEAPASISEQDARRTSQVLRVIMRDLDPGR